MKKYYNLFIACLLSVALCQDGWSAFEIAAMDTAPIQLMTAAINPSTEEIYYFWWSLHRVSDPTNISNSILQYRRRDTSSNWTDPITLISRPLKINVADPVIIFNDNGGTFNVFTGINYNSTPKEKYVVITEYEAGSGQELNQTIVFQVADTTGGDDFHHYDLAENPSGDLFAVTDYNYSARDEHFLLYRACINQQWSEVTTISSWDDNSYEFEPSIYVDSNNNPHITFVGLSPKYADPMEHYNNWRVYYINSSDSGKTWTDPVFVNKDFVRHARLPHIIVDSKNIRHILWNEDVNGDLWPDAIYYGYSIDGKHWSYPRKLSPNGDASYHLLMAYQMVIDNNDILYFQSQSVVDGEPIKQYVFGRENTWSVIDISNNGFPEILYGPGRFVASKDKIHSIWPRIHYEDDLITLKEVALIYHWKSIDNLSTKSPFPLPNKFSINIYPNPFNPVTTIRYELPKFSHVKLSVYDILGREVAQLINTNQDPGIKQVQWNASSIPSGIYFVQMQAGDFRQVRKVMVLK